MFTESFDVMIFLRALPLYKVINIFREYDTYLFFH